MENEVPVSELLGGTIVQVYDRKALLFMIEKGGEHYEFFVEGYDVLVYARKADVVAQIADS